MERPTPRGPSLASRAAIAIGLTVVFYLVAISLALLMLYFAWLHLTSSDRKSLQLLAFLLAGSIGILIGVLPRWERFEPPGPVLDPQDQPRLFEELRRIAKATGQTMPRDVYLVGDLNAGVMQRGGFMGFGGRRVMILGLPLMTVFTESEFRAVLAHEFGHFSGGETSIGGRLYRTQATLFRTIEVLAKAQSLVRFPFIWYAKAFLRITNSISRQQELAADDLAAQLGGAAALGDGLRKLAAMSLAYPAYFQTEVVPVLMAGFRPPLVDGFQRFIATPGSQEATRRAIESTLKNEQEDPYDSHPPLRVRLSHLGNPAPRNRSSRESLALALLDDVPGLEMSLLTSQFPVLENAQSLQWKEVGREVFMPLWREAVSKEKRLLQGATVDGLAALLRPVAGKRRWAVGASADAVAARGPTKVAKIAGRAILVALVDRGWSLVCMPGEEVTVFRGPRMIAPFSEVEKLVAGELTDAMWAERCRELDLVGVPLV
jgi:Zn-dependent protease with chaperone function